MALSGTTKHSVCSTWIARAGLGYFSNTTQHFFGVQINYQFAAMKYTVNYEFLTKTENLVECHQTLSSRGRGGWGLGTRLVVTYLNGLRLPAYHFPLLLVVFPITAGNLVPLSSKECKLFIILTT